MIALLVICMAAPAVLAERGPPLLCAEITLRQTPPMTSEAECERFVQTIVPQLEPWRVMGWRCRPAPAADLRGV